MYRIAVVDDDSSILELARDAFAERGWTALPVPDLKAAPSLVREERPDVVLLDMWQDHQDTGWGVLQRLKADPATRRIPVVIWTIHPSELADRTTWLRRYGIRVLTKPFDLDDLYRAVEDAVTGRVLVSP